MEERQQDLMTPRRVKGLGYYANEKRERAIMDLESSLRAIEMLIVAEKDPKKMGLLYQAKAELLAAILELKDMKAAAQQENLNK